MTPETFMIFLDSSSDVWAHSTSQSSVIALTNTYMVNYGMYIVISEWLWSTTEPHKLFMDCSGC